MQRIKWSNEFEIGINVIDAQHRRIVSYINTLADVEGKVDRQAIAVVIDALVDYTYSHFAFEEALMEEADYEYLSVHQQTHDAFTRRISDLHQRFKDGKDVSSELGELLQTWLIDHIQSDDQSYAPKVREQYKLLDNKSNGSWISKTVSRFFPGE